MKTMRIPLVAMAFALCTSGAFAQTAREIRGPAGVVPLASVAASYEDHRARFPET